MLAGLLGIALAANVGCGDDDGGGDDADDGDDVDDGDDDGEADAGPDAAVEMNRTGLVAVTETVVTNPLALLGPAPAVSGAVVSISYIDDATVTVPPVKGFDTNVNGCYITVYDVKAGDEEPEAVDEGPLVVSGTLNGEFGCAFDKATGEYQCQSTDAEIAGGVAGNAEGATVDPDGALVLPGAAFTPEMVGMRILLTGFEDKGGKPADGIYPIVGEGKDSETLLLDGFPFEAVAVDGATYTTFVGTGPMFNFGTVDFLDDGLEDVVIDKVDSDLVPGFTMTAGARGEGFTLSKDSTFPHEFPMKKADDVIFACEDKGCGADPEQEVGQLDAIVVNGVTTDVLPPIKDDDGFTMLPAETAFATFTCSAVGADSITIPLEGVEAILGTNPLRVQVTVGRFVAQLETEANSGTTVVLGHSLTGFTTLEL